MVDDFREYSETKGNSRTAIAPKLLQYHVVDGFDDGISEADCYYDDDYVNKMGGDHYSDK